MKELIEKLSSYNILNYLLPGALFAVFVERITSYKVVQTDIVIALFLYYFIGMVISRVGSFRSYSVYPVRDTVSPFRISLPKTNHVHPKPCWKSQEMSIIKSLSVGKGDMFYITFGCEGSEVHVYVSISSYSVNLLKNKHKSDIY